jgi:hypothetical protein
MTAEIQRYFFEMCGMYVPMKSPILFSRMALPSGLIQNRES